jgi:hypothetical protein
LYSLAVIRSEYIGRLGLQIPTGAGKGERVRQFCDYQYRGRANLSPVTTATLRTLRVGKRDYPVVLPSVRDPRLHLAAVIISIHVLGQTALGFRVSVPQILSAIVTCAAIEVVLTLRRTGQLVWPASAMLTGSGVALIFRVLGTERGDHWSWRSWYLFAVVAAVSLLTKYVIRHRGSHVFNPSNVGLVLAFLLLGSSRVEPLDFWWAPFDGWMVFAYLIILVGGLLITARLRLLGMAMTFWVTLVAGLGLVAASGHCITAAWSLSPVCGLHFLWVVVTSPEILIFLFFMITDPKTIPIGSVARIAFAVCLAAVSTLLIAPQTTEFGAKVGLLAGLVVMTPLRLFFDRLFQGQSAHEHPIGAIVTRLTKSSHVDISPVRVTVRGAIVGACAVFLVAGTVAAGAPAREPQLADLTADASQIRVEVDPTTLPPVTVGSDVTALNSDIVSGDFNDLATQLAENLKVEGEAMLSGDSSLLLAVDSGERLAEMQRRIDEAVATGERRVQHYTFESLALSVVFTNGSQGGPGLGFEARGVVEEITHDALGAEKDRTTSPFASTFVLRQGSGDRWLLVEVLPVSSS